MGYGAGPRVRPPGPPPPNRSCTPAGMTITDWAPMPPSGFLEPTTRTLVSASRASRFVSLTWKTLVAWVSITARSPRGDVRVSTSPSSPWTVPAAPPRLAAPWKAPCPDAPVSAVASRPAGLPGALKESDCAEAARESPPVPPRPGRARC